MNSKEKQEKQAKELLRVLKNAGLIAEIYDPITKTSGIMITKKGAEWYAVLGKLIGTEEPSKKGNKTETMNKVMNKILDGMEAVAKFGQSIDKSTGGKPRDMKHLWSYGKNEKDRKSVV